MHRLACLLVLPALLVLASCAARAPQPPGPCSEVRHVRVLDVSLDVPACWTLAPDGLYGEEKGEGVHWVPGVSNAVPGRPGLPIARLSVLKPTQAEELVRLANQDQEAFIRNVLSGLPQATRVSKVRAEASANTAAVYYQANGQSAGQASCIFYVVASPSYGLAWTYLAPPGQTDAPWHKAFMDMLESHRVHPGP